MASIKVTYIGHASFRLESGKGTVVYFDPWLDQNPTTRMKVSQVRKADLVVSSHGHNDHVADAFEICKRTRARFVGCYELCLVAQAHGLKLGTRALPMNPGGTVKVKDVAVTLTQAQHSMSMSPNLIKGPPPDDEYFRADGSAAGCVLAFDNGISVYDSSDTCLFGDMELIGQMYGPQIALLPVGGQYTMGIREAARAASLIHPDIVVPCHYGETMGQPADIKAFESAVSFLSSNVEGVPLRPGQTLTYTSSRCQVSK